MNAAIITARGGSARLPGKHTWEICGRRLIEYPILAALDAKRVDKTYLATDTVEFKEIAWALGAEILALPPGLCGDRGTQAASLGFAVSVLDTRYSNLANVVALLGNTVMIDAETVDRALELLDVRSEIDSVMSVWQAEDDHPLRAMRVSPEGFLECYFEHDHRVSNVQTYTKAYFHDQGLWAFRKRCAYENEGPPPWTWMGKKCVPLVRPWWAGRDVDVAFDLEMAEFWVKRQK